MSLRFRDFDEAWSQRKTEPLLAKIAGKTYRFPASLPAKTVLVMQRKTKDRKPDEIVELDVVIELLGPIVGGRETIDEWLDAGIDVDQLNEILEWVVAAYMIPSSDRAKDETDPPAEGTTTTEPSSSTSSLNGGALSNPIGVASTERI